jgi:hypothetical protein
VGSNPFLSGRGGAAPAAAPVYLVQTLQTTPIIAQPSQVQTVQVQTSPVAIKTQTHSFDQSTWTTPTAQTTPQQPTTETQSHSSEPTVPAQTTGHTQPLFVPPAYAQPHYTQPDHLHSLSNSHPHLPSQVPGHPHVTPLSQSVPLGPSSHQPAPTHIPLSGDPQPGAVPTSQQAYIAPPKRVSSATSRVCREKGGEGG